jgi:hypothetical protein
MTTMETISLFGVGFESLISTHVGVGSSSPGGYLGRMISSLVRRVVRY